MLAIIIIYILKIVNKCYSNQVLTHYRFDLITTI